MNSRQWSFALISEDEGWHTDEILVGVSIALIAIGYALYTIAVSLEGFIGGEDQ